MKKSAIILALALSAALVSSCRFFAVSDSANIKFNVGEKVEASDVIETRTFPVAPFDAVDVGMACRMEYVPGDCGVQIRTHDNLFEHLEVSVDDGTLSIRQDGSSFRGMDTMEIFIQSPTLAGADLSGAADFDAAEGIKTDGEFKLRASGACDVDIRKLEAPSAELKLSGACSLKLTGVDSGELRLHCRHRMKYRHHKKHKRPTKATNIPDRVSIHERPAEADGSRFGDWEMDLILGKGQKSAILTLCERSRNYLIMGEASAGKEAGCRGRDGHKAPVAIQKECSVNNHGQRRGVLPTQDDSRGLENHGLLRRQLRLMAERSH